MRPADSAGGPARPQGEAPAGGSSEARGEPSDPSNPADSHGSPPRADLCSLGLARPALLIAFLVSSKTAVGPGGWLCREATSCLGTGSPHRDWAVRQGRGGRQATVPGSWGCGGGQGPWSPQPEAGPPGKPSGGGEGARAGS